MDSIIILSILSGGIIPVLAVAGWFINHILNTFNINFWAGVGMVDGLDMSSISVAVWWYHTLFGFCVAAICWIIGSIFRRK
jgi:hypothetical protein